MATPWDEQSFKSAAELGPGRSKGECRAAAREDFGLFETPGRTPPLPDLEPARTAAAPARTWNILFVDDDPRALRLCANSFRDSHYIVHCAGSAATGLDVIRDYPIDLVLSDMRMPGMNGAEFLNEVARRQPDILRLLISGKFDMSETIEGINKGRIYGYVSKPFDSADLRLIVERALLEKGKLERRGRCVEERQKQAESRIRDLGQQLGQARSETAQAYDTGIQALIDVVGSRGGEDEAAARRQALALQLAGELGQDEAFCAQLRVAALLQELAEVMLPRDWRDKAVVDLQEQHRHYRELPVSSAALVARFKPYAEAARMIRHHHERCDGKGYPDALLEQDIPLGARILRVVNDYEELRRTRRMTHGQAMHLMVSHRARYDARLLVLLKRVGEGC